MYTVDIKRLAFFTLFLFLTITIQPVAMADVVWNADLGKFVSVDMVIHDDPETQFEYAERMYEEKDYDEAAKAYNNLFYKFPDSKYAQRSLYQLGLILEIQGHYYEAFKNYQKIFNFYPHSSLLNDALERQFRIGNLFLSGKKKRFYGLPILPGTPYAVEVFETITKNAPFSSYGRKAQFYRAMALKKKGDYTEAVDEFRTFINNYPQSDLRAEARFQIADTYYKKVKYKFNDEKLLTLTKQALQEFLVDYPHTLEAERAREMLNTLTDKDAERIYKIAEYYEKESYLESSILYYKEVVETYPESRWAEKARERLRTFEDPEEFILEGQKSLTEQLSELEDKREKLLEQPITPTTEKALFTIEEKIDTTEKDLKRLSKLKRKEADIRWEALRRKKRELKEKKEKLQEKEELLLERPSADLENALKRWKESLKAEEYALQSEERELLSLERRLGIRRFFSWIMSAASNSVEEVKKYKESKISKIREDIERLEKEKNIFYEEHEQLAEGIMEVREKQGALLASDLEVKKSLGIEHAKWLKEKEELNALRAEYRRIKKELKDEKGFLPSLVSLPKTSVASIIKPFVQTEEEELEEEIKALQERYETYANELAFEEAELKRFENIVAGMDKKKEALQKEAEQELKEDEQQEPESGQDENADSSTMRQKQIDERQARKRVMVIEKKINSAHQQVEDAQRKKQKLLAELDEEIDLVEKTEEPVLYKIRNGIAAPVVLLYKGVNAFIFGLKNKEKAVTEKAERIEEKNFARDNQRIKDLKAQIKEQDSLIKSGEVEIIAYELELEQLIDSLEGTVVAKKKRDLQKHESMLTKAIEEKKKRIDELKRQKEEIKNALDVALATQKQMKREGEEPQQESKDTSQEETVVDEESLRLEHEKALEDLRSRIIHKERVVADLAQAARIAQGTNKLTKDERRRRKQIRESEERMDEKLRDLIEEDEQVREDIEDIIEDQIELFRDLEELISEKIQFAKKRVQQMEEYQDPDLDVMKEEQKLIYKELDEVRSKIEKLNQAKAQIGQ